MEAVGEGLQPGRAGRFYGFLHLVGPLGGGRAGPARVGEDVQEGWPDVLQQPVRLLEIFVRLPREAHDHVDAEEDARVTLLRRLEDVADQRDLGFEHLCRVTAVHRLQGAVAARLDGDVEVRQELRARGDPAQDLLREQVRLDRGDSETLDARHRVQRLQQVQEGLPGALAEVARVHARQHHLHDALRRDGAGLLHDLRDGDVAALAAGQRHGAVGAVVVAAVLDLQEGAGALARRVGREEAFHGVNLAGIALRAALAAQQEPDQLALAVRADHQVHAFDREDLLRLQLRVAARDGDFGAGRGLVELPDEVAALLVGVLGHRAGVDHEDVRVRTGRSLLVARRGELPREGGALREVELAAEGDERDLTHRLP